MTNAGVLFGAFLVPLILLWAGHRMRGRSDRWRSAFWGATIAYGVLIPVSMLAAMMPPEEWESGDRWRGVLAVWSLSIGPAIGALLGAITRRSRAP